MNRYWLHAASGELSLARDNGKNIEKESEPQIILLNMEEFQQLEGNYPHRKNLISSMRFIRYSKVEAFHECVQGIIHVPKQGSKKEKEFSFGFYLFENISSIWRANDLEHSIWATFCYLCQSSCLVIKCKHSSCKRFSLFICLFKGNIRFLQNSMISASA